VGDAENKEKASMKTFLAGVALAAALASPALAQRASHYTVPSAQYTANARHGYVYPADRHAHSSNPANDVYDVRGRYIGSDPDPFIRDYLARGHSQD
jgi:opacity protein-like surface antigen